MAKGLRANGVKVDEGEDWWDVIGLGPNGVPGGATVEARLDHRIAMSFLCLGMATTKPVTVDDAAPVRTSFPVFEPLMTTLGASFERVNQ
jgi:3-phosphoshikimate 1-carboxyvinyltransferase